MPKYQTIKEAGYKFLYHTEGELALLNLESGLIEFFAKAKNFAGWAIQWRGTQWEFYRSYNTAEQARFTKGLQTIQNYGEQHPSFMNAHKMLAKLGAL